jgi:hypothetical protein
MNPYPKGLGSEVYAQSAPTSAGKVATHFNSPYMRAISQNLITAIYGSPQDELTRQRIEQSKLAMDQTRAQMDQAAAEQQARDQFAMDLLGDDSLFDPVTGDLTPKGRRVLTAQGIRSGQGIPDVWYDTGAHQGRVILQGNEQGWKDNDREDRQAYQTGRDNTLHLQDIFMTGLEHENNLDRLEVQNSYDVAQILKRHENDVALKQMQNEWQANQNATDRVLDATTTLLDYSAENQETPEQLGSLFELMGITAGEDMLQNISAVTPRPTSSSRPQSLVPFKRMYDFAFAQGITNGMSEEDAVAELSRVASEALELLNADTTNTMSEAEAVQRVIQMGQTPTGNNLSNTFVTPSGVTITRTN